MYLKPKELQNYVNTTGEGTRENPKVKELPWNYKLPLYLGYTIKWDYDWRTEVEYSPNYKTWNEWTITPRFKKSHDSFDCHWDYNNWDFLMEVLLPKMEEDGLLNEIIKEFVLSFDRWSVIVECMNIINKEVTDINYPFINIKEEDRINKKHLIY